MEFDDLMKKLGEFGRYQKWLFFLLSLTGIVGVFTSMAIVFIAGVPDHWCSVPELDALNLTREQKLSFSIPQEAKNGQTVYSSCKVYDRNYSAVKREDVLRQIAAGNSSYVGMRSVPCSQGWTYDKSLYTSTIVSEFGLVCDRSWLQATASSVYFAGVMFGVLFFGTLSDMLGRRKSLLLCTVIVVGTFIGSSWSPNYLVFVIIRFFLAASQIGGFTTGFVMLMEVVGPSYRVDVGIGIEYFWAFGYLLIAGAAFLIRDWFTLNLVLGCPLAGLLVYFWLVPESARWLYAKGRDEEADAVIRHMAKRNKVQLPEKLDIVVRKDNHNASILDLFRTPRLRCRTMNLCFNWFVNSLVYYGLSLNSSNLGGNPYINFCISGAVEIPAYIASQLTLRYLGRRWPLSVSMIIGGASLLATLAVPKGPELNWVVITLAMVGKFCIAASFAIIYVFTAEIYPTVVRQVGVSTGSVFARVGGIVAPYIALLSEFGEVIPLITFGASSVLAGVLALTLPETKGCNLPQTIQEGEVFGTKRAIQLNDPTSAESGKGTMNPGFAEDEEKV